jgi:hypothetical protein
MSETQPPSTCGKMGGNLHAPLPSLSCRGPACLRGQKLPRRSELAGEIEHGDFSLVRRNEPAPRGPDGPERIVDPIEYALMALGQIATDERRPRGRKMLIWVGPGWGIGTGGIEGSRIHSDLFDTICWFSTPLREARLALYSFSVGESESSLHSNRTRTIWLEQLPIEPA